MSRQQRRKNIWPSDEIAVHLWHVAAALEDINDLVGAWKATPTPDAKVAVCKKLLVELKALDEELLPKLQNAIREGKGVAPRDADREQALAAFSVYHRAVQPSRKLLADIRNTFGAHRRALPDDGDRKNYGNDFASWGAWEHHLIDLEKHCTVERWLEFINAAIALRNELKDRLPGTWYTFEGDSLRLFTPIRID